MAAGGSPVFDDTINPCVKEHLVSFRCLENTNYDQKKCEIAFENYRICKKFWGKIYNKRRREGVHPYLPPPQERQKIKEDWLAGRLKL